MRRLSLAIAFAALLPAACRSAFQPQKFTSQESLYRASKREYDAKRYENAVAGFERLTIELPARDTLFPRSLYFLAKSHVGRKEHLLSAQNFTRLAESFPSDSLADDALFQAGLAYARLWRKPALDAQYGETALSTLRTMLAVYPSSALAGEAQKEINNLVEWFARKAYANGMHYYRRKAWDSAIIYFKDVVAKYPETATARDALLRLAVAFQAIGYKEDVTETCNTLRSAYSGDRQVREICGAAPVAATSPTP
ncbi:MAG: outer membrane protein assembly factor BamD [Anaerolineae bacterium]|nr:outer membrane protein assembly factor BamD [Gemmatimonadaceae bacterium]